MSDRIGRTSVWAPLSHHHHHNRKPHPPQNSYLGYNNPGATETDIEAYVSQVTYGLFSVLATVGTVPVIRCAGCGPAEMVARRLNELISEYLLGGSGAGSTPFFSRSTAAAFHRPLLVLFDRNDDLITALHHTSTYQVRVDQAWSLSLPCGCFVDERWGDGPLDPRPNPFFPHLQPSRR